MGLISQKYICAPRRLVITNQRRYYHILITFASNILTNLQIFLILSATVIDIIRGMGVTDDSGIAKDVLSSGIMTEILMAESMLILF